MRGGSQCVRLASRTVGSGLTPPPPPARSAWPRSAACRESPRLTQSPAFRLLPFTTNHSLINQQSTMVASIFSASARQAAMPLVARRAALQAPRGARFIHIENNIETVSCADQRKGRERLFRCLKVTWRRGGGRDGVYSGRSRRCSSAERDRLMSEGIVEVRLRGKDPLLTSPCSNLPLLLDHPRPFDTCSHRLVSTAAYTITSAQSELAPDAPSNLPTLHLQRHAVPFKTGPKHRVGVALGVTAFLGTGFGLPFVAAYFQLA